MAMSNVVLADLELRHLAALRAVAEEGSFGRAATKLGYTQSAISQQIGSLERIIGDPVFDRPGGPRAVRLTPTGTLLLTHARSILDRVRVAEADLSSLRCAETGHLAVGTFQSVSVHVLPQILAELHQSHPDAEIELFESDELDDLLGALRTGALDITFTASVFDSEEFELRPLYTDPFVVMCPLDSDILPAEGPVPVERLEGIPMVAEHPTACQFMIEKQLARLGVSLNVVFRTSDNSAIQAMVRRRRRPRGGAPAGGRSERFADRHSAARAADGASVDLAGQRRRSEPAADRRGIHASSGAAVRPARLSTGRSSQRTGDVASWVRSHAA